MRDWLINKFHEIIPNIIRFALSITFFCFVCICVFKISIAVIGIAFLFLVLYACSSEIGQKSMKKLKMYEQKLIHSELSNKDQYNILFLSLTTLSPIWFCILIVSLVPLYTYEVWFITVFPAVLLNCLPASSVLDEYYLLTHKKIPFMIIFLLVTIICCILGIVASHLFLKII